MASLKPSQARPPSPNPCGLPVLLSRTLQTICMWGPVAPEGPHRSRPGAEQPPCELGCSHGLLHPDSAPCGSLKGQRAHSLQTHRVPSHSWAAICPMGLTDSMASSAQATLRDAQLAFGGVGLDYGLLTPLIRWNKPLSPNANLCSKVALSLQHTPPPPKKSLVPTFSCCDTQHRGAQAGLRPLTSLPKSPSQPSGLYKP